MFRCCVLVSFPVTVGNTSGILFFTKSQCWKCDVLGLQYNNITSKSLKINKKCIYIYIYAEHIRDKFNQIESIKQMKLFHKSQKEKVTHKIENKFCFYYRNNSRKIKKKKKKKMNMNMNKK